jgi:transketolase
MTLLMAEHVGMCYMRTHRPATRIIYKPGKSFEVGGSHQHREGERLTIVTGGYMLGVVLEAADRLAADGLPCNVFDAYSFPLRAEPILAVARRSGGRILTVEDNYGGGLYSAVAETAAGAGNLRVEGLYCRRIPKSARSAEDLLEYLSLSPGHIEAAARKLAEARG